MNDENLKQLLDEFLQIHYNGTFSRMVSEYSASREWRKQKWMLYWRK